VQSHEDCEADCPWTPGEPTASSRSRTFRHGPAQARGSDQLRAAKSPIALPHGRERRYNITMRDPLSPTSGAMPRLVLAALVLAGVWAVTAWAMAA